MGEETQVPTMTAAEVEDACRTLHKGETPEQCERRHRRERDGYPLPDALPSDLCGHPVEQIAAEGE